MALVMIGDGEDNMSRYSSDQVASLFLRSSWPPVFGLILDYDHADTRRGYFNKIVSATGGTAVIPRSASKVAEAQTVLAAEVFAPMKVTLKVPRSITQPVKLKLRVVGPRHAIHVAQPAEVAACAPTSSPQ